MINNRFKHDGEFVSIQPTQSKNWFANKVSDQHLPQKYVDYANQWLVWYNVEAETTKLLKEILLLTTWCKYNKIKYVIFSSALQENHRLSNHFMIKWPQTSKLLIFLNSVLQNGVLDVAMSQ